MTISRLLIIAAATALLIPPLVFCLAGLSKGMGLGVVLAACFEQFSAERQNLGVTALLGLFPVGLTALLLWFQVNPEIVPPALVMFWAEAASLMTASPGSPADQLPPTCQSPLPPFQVV